jgi:cytochrome c peroxidase
MTNWAGLRMQLQLRLRLRLRLRMWLRMLRPMSLLLTTLPATACPLPAPSLQQGAVQALWKVAGPPITVGRHFAIDVQLCPADAVLTRVDAQMPEHQHGMNYKPSLKRVGGAPDGRWRAEGLLFHMPGRWELRLDVQAAGSLERLTDTVTLVSFSPEERARIAAHGPWPPPRSVDAGNRVDGHAAAIELGRRLFMTAGLSAQGTLACSGCHDPKRGFQDGKTSARNGRNTPSLWNVGQQRWLGWDGAADSLWAASLAPLTAHDELAATPHSMVVLLQRDRDLGQRYRALFGPPQPDTRLMVNLAKALAAYQAKLTTPRTAFDSFRDALLRGDTKAASRYPAAAQRGLKIFVGAGRCFFCHAGPAFSNGEFADIGRPFFNAQGADAGRWGGLQRLLASLYNRLGLFSDAGPDDARATSTRHVVMEPRHFGEFKVPGLRGLGSSTPYFHDGSAATLEDVVHHYSELDENRLHADGAKLLQALKLTPQQTSDLVAFLKTLGAP